MNETNTEGVPERRDNPLYPEFKVGQKWRCRGGKVAEILKIAAREDFPILALIDGESYRFDRNGVVRSNPMNDIDEQCFDLVELIEDAPATEIDDITSIQASDLKNDMNELAAETLQSFGWHFDGTCWVQDQPPTSAELPPGVTEHPLYPIFIEAIEQAMFGKGERHGGAVTPFMEQPWVHYAKMHGRGFLTGQAAKKLEEAASKRTGDAFVTEVLGAMVYAGMAVIYERGEVK